MTGELLLDAESPGRRVGAIDRRRNSGDVADGRGERRVNAERRRTIASTIADGVGLYWRYEKRIRHFESMIGSTLGATGAIYAIRRSLWRPLPAETILDDVLAPMRVVLAGYRTVFSERAHAFDRAAPNADVEMSRKIRTIAGNYSLEGLRGFPEPPPGAHYDGPVLWIAGANSHYVLPEDRVHMDALFPTTRLVRIKNAGHWVHSEQPEIFTETVRRFLDHVEQSPDAVANG